MKRDHQPNINPIRQINLFNVHSIHSFLKVSFSIRRKERRRQHERNWKMLLIKKLSENKKISSRLRVIANIYSTTLATTTASPIDPKAIWNLSFSLFFIFRVRFFCCCWCCFVSNFKRSAACGWRWKIFLFSRHSTHLDYAKSSRGHERHVCLVQSLLCFPCSPFVRNFLVFITVTFVLKLLLLFFFFLHNFLIYFCSISSSCLFFYFGFLDYLFKNNSL